MFIAITDAVDDISDIDQVLLLADNMPLAIDLIAHLVDSEGISNVLHRWETEKTSILSEGHDARSNLEFSIALSLSGLRMASSPHAQQLLSLLSMLPDGLSDVELLQSNLPLKNILACKSCLLRTALAYIDDQKRLKTLVPIQEYVRKIHPPGQHLVQLLFNHFEELLELYRTFDGTISNTQIITRIQSNFANIQNLLLDGLSLDNPEVVKVIYSTCDLNSWSEQMGYGGIPLMNKIPDILPQPADNRVEVYFICKLLAGWRHHPVPHILELISKALSLFDQLNDPDLKCKLPLSFWCLI
jgi:hypothetical protein